MDHAQIIEDRFASAPDVSVSVERKTRLEAARMRREHLDAGRPVILSDLCAHWPALGKWSPDFLRRTIPEVRAESDGHWYSIAELMDRIEHPQAGARAIYLREFYLAQQAPVLLADLPEIPYDALNRLNVRALPLIPHMRGGGLELLVAGNGTQFPVLHYDLHHYHAFITQIHGDKRFWLYPPDQTPAMYPRAEAPNLSAIDRFDPVDPQRFPRFASARGTEFVLRPGETLFIPAGWWHRTQMLSTSVAVTWNCVTGGNWRSFTEDYHLAVIRRQRPLRTLLKTAYLAALGRMLDARDRLAFS